LIKNDKISLLCQKEHIKPVRKAEKRKLVLELVIHQQMEKKFFREEEKLEEESSQLNFKNVASCKPSYLKN
jgi:hypothetical protein